MAKINADAVLNIINIILRLEPIGLQLAQELLTKLDGKTDAEILADENVALDAIIAKAKAEIAKNPPSA